MEDRDLGDAAVVAASTPPFPGLAIGMRREMSRLACAYSETTNLTRSVLLELNQEGCKL